MTGPFRVIPPAIVAFLGMPSWFHPPETQDAVQSCEISLEKIVELKGDEVGSGPVALLTSDKIFLVRTYAPQEIAVFDRDGDFLGTLGQPGQGPGEFQVISALLALPDGGIAAFDPRNHRVTQFTSELETGANYSLPVQVSNNGALRLKNGDFVLAGRMRENRAFGSPLVRVDSIGRMLTYYGRNETEKEGNLRGLMVDRKVAYHPRVGVVSMKRTAYFLERWDDDGTLSDVFIRDVGWFHWPPPLDPGRDPHRWVGEPENLFFGIQFDDAGRLWVLARITGEQWKRGVKEGQVVDQDKWADFFIEVVDLENRRTLCTRRITDRQFIGAFPAPGVIHSYREDWLGRPTVTFWRLSLRSP